MKKKGLSVRRVKQELTVRVGELEQQLSHYQQQVASSQADLSLERDRYHQTLDLLERRPKDRRLAEILCDWMNMHGKEKLCMCDLCKETKAQMNALGDPIIHTAEGWKCVEGNKDFERRDVAAEFTDNTVKIGAPITDTESE